MRMRKGGFGGGKPGSKARTGSRKDRQRSADDGRGATARPGRGKAPARADNRGDFRPGRPGAKKGPPRRGPPKGGARGEDRFEGKAAAPRGAGSAAPREHRRTERPDQGRFENRFEKGRASAGRPPRGAAVAPPPPPPSKPAPNPANYSAGVQNVTVTADENGMRVDRFFEARFPGLSFGHIQRIIRKGEVRVNGKRTEPKNRLEGGQVLRIPPLQLEAPKVRDDAPQALRDREFIRSITLSEDDDVLVLNKPMGLAVQGGSGITQNIDDMLESLRGNYADAQRPRLVHRLDKDTAGCLLVAKTRFAAAALAKTFRTPTGRWSPACRSRSRGGSRPTSPSRKTRKIPTCASPGTARRTRCTP